MPMTRSERFAQIAPLREAGLKWREIADRLGISLSLAHDIYTDPEGIGAMKRRRESAARLRTACEVCGQPSSPSARLCQTCRNDGLHLGPRPLPTPGILWARRRDGFVKTLVDVCDWERFKDMRWSISGPGQGYAKHGDQYLHRLVCGLGPNDRWPDGKPKVVDHLNRDPFDNRRANLSVGTQRDNCNNRGGQFDVWEQQRAKMVELHAAGHSPPEIAEQLGRSLVSVYRVLRGYKTAA